MSEKESIGLVVFDGFETLDVFGPCEMFGLMEDKLDVTLVSRGGKPVASRQGPVASPTAALEDANAFDMILIPGGFGTRALVDDASYIDLLGRVADSVPTVLTVCTGSGLLAKTGVLDGYRATSNKFAFDWVKEMGPNVKWVNKARWVTDDKFTTSAGVSAGMDMALGVIAERYGHDRAVGVANYAEYEWHQDAAWDPFAEIYGLAENAV